jgi:uncharacterized membrane protein
VKQTFMLEPNHRFVMMDTTRGVAAICLCHFITLLEQSITGPVAPAGASWGYGSAGNIPRRKVSTCEEVAGRAPPYET